MEIDLIYESIYSGLALMDSQVQIWTTFTFALLVAVHVGAERLTSSILKLAMVLYGFYASILILRNVSATFQILHYQHLLVERGLEPWPVPNAIGTTIGIGTLILLLGGSIATLCFVYARFRTSVPKPTFE